MMRRIVSLVVVVLGIMVIVINFVNNPEKSRILFMEMDNWTFRAIWAFFVVYSGYNFYRTIKKK